jgi:hypothetical protein
MLKSQDIVVLIKLCGLDSWTFASLGEELGLSPSAVHRSLGRASEAGLYDAGQRRVKASQLNEYLVHGVKYAFPPVMLGEVRGIPTAWAAAPLAGRLAPQNSLPPVWPHPLGRERGIGLEPIHPIVPDAARDDPGFAERLALVDAIRMGDARIRAIAAEELEQRLMPAAIA